MPKAKFVSLAQDVAYDAHGEFRHGAVVVRNGRVLSTACNKFLGSTNSRASTHAEENALSQIKRCEARGSTMIVVRVNNQGDARLSKPCPRCAQISLKLGVRTIYFSQ
jgi:pyrimidine deaminase RibD-like protein